MNRTFTKTLGVALAAVCWAASPLIAGEQEELAALTESITATSQELSAELQAKKLEDKAFMRKLVTQLVKSYGVQNRFLVAQVVVKQHPDQAELVAKEILRHSPVDAGRLDSILSDRNVATALERVRIPNGLSSAPSDDRGFVVPSAPRRRTLVSGGTANTPALVQKEANDTVFYNGPGSGDGNLTAFQATYSGTGQLYNLTWTGSGSAPANEGAEGSGWTLSVSGNVYTFTKASPTRTITFTENPD